MRCGSCKAWTGLLGGKKVCDADCIIEGCDNCKKIKKCSKCEGDFCSSHLEPNKHDCASLYPMEEKMSDDEEPVIEYTKDKRFAMLNRGVNGYIGEIQILAAISSLELSGYVLDTEMHDAIFDESEGTLIFRKKEA